MAKESFVGRAGQLAVMAELLLRGYNVAIPEVDVGDDVLVVDDQADNLWRVQVKTAKGVERGYGHSGQFAVSLAQLRAEGKTPLWYVLTLRRRNVWDFVILPQARLNREHRRSALGAEVEGKVVLYVAFRETEVICSGRDWQECRDDWSAWPEIHS